MLDASIQGLVALFTPQSLLFLLLGVSWGIVIGFLPGVGGIVAMALLLPFVFGQEPAAAMALLLGAHVATIYNDSITGILFNVPGAAKGVALCFDGYPMTRRGEATRALGAAATASFIGGIIGALFLTLSLPFVRAVMLALGPPEYFVMALWGLSVIAVFSEGSVLKGLVAAGFGLLLAFVGQDPVTATSRFTFGSLYLADGIDFAVAAIGLFAISQMMVLYTEGGAIVKRQVLLGKSSVWDGVKDTFRHPRLILQSTLLGLFVGVLPGIGATVGGIAAYGQAVQTSKHPERFGTGAVEGVIAPSTTLGANEGAGLLPTLGFGIPGGESAAILLSAFIIMGIAPGPEMLTKGLPLVFSMVWIIIIANILTTVAGLFTAPYLARLTTMPGNMLIPLVMAVCFVGAYSINRRIEDVAMAGAFGLLGYVMRKYRYSRADLAIGMVLGLMVERYLQISLTLNGAFFWLTRPVTFLLLVVVIATVLWPFIQKRRHRMNVQSPVTA